MNYYYQNTKLGYITVEENNGKIVSLKFGKFLLGYEFKKTELIETVFKQLDEYFDEERKSFDIPIEVVATNFEQKIFKILKQIPYGMTVSYGDIADRLGSRSYSRAVGNACKRNPILIIVPCHRVISSSGELSQYVAGQNLKEKLLRIERAIPLFEKRN